MSCTHNSGLSQQMQGTAALHSSFEAIISDFVGPFSMLQLPGRHALCVFITLCCGRVDRDLCIVSF